MKRHHDTLTTPQRAILASFMSLSLGACSLPISVQGARAASRAGLLAKETNLLSASAQTYAYNDITALLESLTYNGTDVACSLNELYIESTDGRVIIWHDYEIPNYEDVPEVMQRDSSRCLALACALYGNNIENTTGGTSPFKSVTWVLSDGHGNNYFALVDHGGTAYTINRPYDLFPQCDGFVLSDTTYVSIRRRESGIPPRSGETPCDINGDAVVCEAWLSVPDELWTVGLPQTSENTDASGYWYDEDIEIDSPSTWYQEFIDQDAAEGNEIPEVIIVDPTNPEDPENPVDPVLPGEQTDPTNPDEGVVVDPTTPEEPTDPVEPGEGGEGGETVDPGEGGGEGGGETVDPGEGGGESGGEGGGESGGESGGEEIVYPGGGESGGEDGGDTGGETGGEETVTLAAVNPAASEEAPADTSE